MRFPAKKNAGCPKVPPRKDGILHSLSGCLGTSLPLPQSLYGRTDGRMDGLTLTSQPIFFASIHYQISLAMELRWWALPAGSAKKERRSFNIKVLMESRPSRDILL